MTILDKNQLLEAKSFRSDLKAFLDTPFENDGLTLILCIEGFALLSIELKKYPFKKGDIAIIPKEFSFIPLHTSSMFQAEIISVTTKHCEEMEHKITNVYFWHFMLEHPILRPNTIQYDMLYSWFSQMKWIINDNTYLFRNETISSNILTFFLLIYRETRELIQKHDNEIKRGRTLNIFTDFTNLVYRFHKKHRKVAFYANLLSITPDYLNKVCKMHWETSAKEYIDWQVVMVIKNYLSFTDLSIKCIAAQLNFDDSSYMCRFFKKLTSMSPTQFRNIDK